MACSAISYGVNVRMPLTVCRCCGGKMDAAALRRTANPNICGSCEQLLEDDSPSVMADIGRLPLDQAGVDHLLDEPSDAPSNKPNLPAASPRKAKSSKSK